MIIILIGVLLLFVFWPLGLLVIGVGLVALFAEAGAVIAADLRDAARLRKWSASSCMA